MTNKTFMRVPKELLRDLKDLKVAKGESYADVVSRIIEDKRKKKGRNRYSTYDDQVKMFGY